MSDDFDDLLPDPPPAAGDGLAGHLDQAGIDALFGDTGGPVAPRQGLRAVIESDVVSQERLPMLEVVFDRMVRILATSLRNFSSDSVDVSLEDVASIRFGDFMSRLAIPAMIGVFRVDEWENYGLVTVEPALAYAVIDALLGGKRGGEPRMIDGRAFTAIETELVARMMRIILEDMSIAMEPIAKNSMVLERIEPSPRFAAIAGGTNICAVATFRVELDDRGGKFSILLPHAMIEPVRHLLSQRFMGETLGRDGLWEAHLAAEIRKVVLPLDVVLGERAMPLAEIRDMGVGSTIALYQNADTPLDLRSAGVTLGRVQIGQRSGNIAVRLITDIAKGALA